MIEDERAEDRPIPRTTDLRRGPSFGRIRRIVTAQAGRRRRTGTSLLTRVRTWLSALVQPLRGRGWSRPFSPIRRLFAQVGRHLGKGLHRTGGRIIGIIRRYRGAIQSLTFWLSGPTAEAIAPGGLGSRVLMMVPRLYARSEGRWFAHALLRGGEWLLIAAVGLHTAVGRSDRALVSARLLNLLYRPRIRERAMPATEVYLGMIWRAHLFDRLARIIRRRLSGPEQVRA